MQFLTFLTVLATASLSSAKPIEKRQLGGVSLVQSTFISPHKSRHEMC